MRHTIALVDDDKNILTSVSMALEAEGFNVRAYSDGAEALAGLTQRPADLAILDIKMPRMDGMEVLAKLRSQSRMPVGGPIDMAHILAASGAAIKQAGGRLP